MKLKDVLKGYTKCEIYFHIDLDGVTTALATKEYLKRYFNIETVDCHIIQYGNLQFSVPKAKDGVLPILVDFASGRSMYKIQFDHHQEQRGASDTDFVYAKPARSNVEIVSGEIAPTDIFTHTDIISIQTIDSANFYTHGVQVQDLHKSVFTINTELSADRNRFHLTFVVNRLILAYKNKRIDYGQYTNKNLLECLVLDSNPSIFSIYNNIKKYVIYGTALEYDFSKRNYNKRMPLSSPEVINENLTTYISTRTSTIKNPITGIDERNISIGMDKNYNIIKQLDIGRVFDTGSYDRYVPFKNFPESDYIITIYPMGLVQSSRNPFKEDIMKLDLSIIAKETLNRYKEQLSNIHVSLHDIKKESESELNKLYKKFGKEYNPVGFTAEDLKTYYQTSIYYIPERLLGNSNYEKFSFYNSDEYSINYITDVMNKHYSDWSYTEKEEMKWIKIPMWDIITSTSGGHKSITNLTSFNYMKYNTDGMKKYFNTTDIVGVMKEIGSAFTILMKEKIDMYRQDKEITYSDVNNVYFGSQVSE